MARSAYPIHSTIFLFSALSFGEKSRGKGQIILFPFEPDERGYYPETTRLLWNAVFLGPGLGAEAPRPW